MPAPRRLARFNKRFTNHLTSKVAGYLPGFAIVSHIGRKSGRTYRTPVNAFRTDDGYIIALTYGSESDWVKNVLAAGSCELQTRGRRVRLYNPHIVTDESKAWAPLPVRLILNRIDASQYMRLSAAHRSSVMAREQREEPSNSASPKRSPLRFFLFVFALSIPIWLIEPRDWPITASVGTPLIAALILVYREDRYAGTSRLLRRVFDQKRIKPKSGTCPPFSCRLSSICSPTG
jgi:deazaflavin-dependent oxidoreductase (nitroreductase family)